MELEVFLRVVAVVCLFSGSVLHAAAQAVVQGLTPARGSSSGVGAVIRGSNYTSSSVPMIVAGRITLQDGSEPGEPVLIQRVCPNGSHAEGYTDARGYFSIRLGQDNGVVPGAEFEPTWTPGQAGDVQTASCELKATAPGYFSGAIDLSSRMPMDDPNIGTIVLRPIARPEGLMISATNSLAPKSARDEFAKGTEAARKNKLKDAETHLQNATGIYPRYAAAWVALGEVWERKSMMPEAHEAYRRSIAADEHYIGPYQRLYSLGFRESDWQECVENSERVMHLDPTTPSAYLYNAMANLNLKRLEAAEKSAREAVSLDAHHTNPEAIYVLGAIQVERHDLIDAAQTLRDYLKIAPKGAGADSARKALLEISDFASSGKARK